MPAVFDAPVCITHLYQSAKEIKYLQAAKQPHADISGQETERAVRLSEHLLHLQRQQRRTLAAAAQHHSDLAGLLKIVDGFSLEAIAGAGSAFTSLGQVNFRHQYCILVHNLP